jgi:hypothetical protein
MVASFPKIDLGEVISFAFQFLQAHDVRFALLEPSQQIRKALIDVVDVEGRDLHEPSPAVHNPIVARVTA